jgi:hypothetical protein
VTLPHWRSSSRKRLNSPAFLGPKRFPAFGANVLLVRELLGMAEYAVEYRGDFENNL